MNNSVQVSDVTLKQVQRAAVMLSQACLRLPSQRHRRVNREAHVYERVALGCCVTTERPHIEPATS